MPTHSHHHKRQAVITQHQVNEQQLQTALAQRTKTAQAGDIYLFSHMPELHWVILKPHNKTHFMVVPADDFPLVGSNDVQLPKTAMCSPLTLRCGEMMTLPKNRFEPVQRVGILEHWHLQRALSKCAQISQKNLISTVAKQKVDEDIDYITWLDELATAKQQLQQSMSLPTKKTVQHRIFAWLLSPQRQWRVATVLGTLLVVLMLGVYVKLSSPPLHGDVTQFMTSEHMASLAKTFPDVDSEEKRYGYTPQHKVAVFNEFINGTKSIKNKLRGESAVQYKQTVFFYLGEWTAYMWLATDSALSQRLPTDFWHQKMHRIDALLAEAQKETRNMHETERGSSDFIQAHVVEIKLLLQEIQHKRDADSVSKAQAKTQALIDAVVFRQRHF